MWQAGIAIAQENVHARPASQCSHGNSPALAIANEATRCHRRFVPCREDRPPGHVDAHASVRVSVARLVADRRAEKRQRWSAAPIEHGWSPSSHPAFVASCIALPAVAAPRSSRASPGTRSVLHRCAQRRQGQTRLECGRPGRSARAGSRSSGRGAMFRALDGAEAPFRSIAKQRWSSMRQRFDGDGRHGLECRSCSVDCPQTCRSLPSTFPRSPDFPLGPRGGGSSHGAGVASAWPQARRMSLAHMAALVRLRAFSPDRLVVPESLDSTLAGVPGRRSGLRPL